MLDSALPLVVTSIDGLVEASLLVGVVASSFALTVGSVLSAPIKASSFAGGVDSVFPIVLSCID